MKKNSLLFLAFWSIVLLGVLHWAASFFYFYWTIWWFDVLTHFIGGLSIGLLALWANLTFVNPGEALTPRRNTIFILVAVLVIGIGWELFEYVNGLTQSTESYRLDVIHDLVADLFGATVASLIVVKKKLHLA